MSGSSSMADIAEMAGVSISTVSRYLNNKPVAPDTLERIQSCIEAKGYRPLPREKRSGPKPMAVRESKVGEVCVLLIGLPGDVFKMPALPALMEGIQVAAARHKKRVFFIAYDGQGPLPGELTGRRCDGFLVLDNGSTVAPELLRLMKAHPTVYMLRRFTDERAQFDQVYYDNRLVGEMAARYLLQRGCRRFVFASHVRNHLAFKQRRDDFIAALSAAGIDHVQVVEGDNTLDMRQRLMPVFSSEGRPDGVFAASDDAMLSAWIAAQMAGIPTDDDEGGLFFIGCNNDKPWLRQMHPRPATIDLQFPALGERAFEQLIGRIGHRETLKQVQIVVAPEFLSPEQRSVRHASVAAAL